MAGAAMSKSGANLVVVPGLSDDACRSAFYYDKRTDYFHSNRQAEKIMELLGRDDSITKENLAEHQNRLQKFVMASHVACMMAAKESQSKIADEIIGYTVGVLDVVRNAMEDLDTEGFQDRLKGLALKAREEAREKGQKKLPVSRDPLQSLAESAAQDIYEARRFRYLYNLPCCSMAHPSNPVQVDGIESETKDHTVLTNTNILIYVFRDRDAVYHVVISLQDNVFTVTRVAHPVGQRRNRLADFNGVCSAYTRLNRRSCRACFVVPKDVDIRNVVQVRDMILAKKKKHIH